MQQPSIYDRAKQNGCALQTTCVGIPQRLWDSLMKGARPANKKRVIEIAYQAGVIDLWQANEEKRNPQYNPYQHKVTKTHVIYVHSGIEHFIKVF